MKKVININFQGRVVPIEETAYEMLQGYISSLRSYFANEEGRDEIINDIESRIGELFAEQLKKGAACITDADVNAIMNSMGRPSDFEQADDEPTTAKTQDAGQSSYRENEQAGYQYTHTTEKKRLYRDEEDKVLGGVCSGLAHYLNIDPAIVRIMFALLVLGFGTGIVVYILMWVILPAGRLENHNRKRLYRDSEDKVFGGICGGLAKYFDVSVAIPRVIFAAPFIFGLITSVGRNFFMHGPVFIGSFSGGTFILAYLVLWIVLPEAVTAAEKLEMKGEKVDLNSIRNTIMDDMKGFKGRAEKMGKEFSASAGELGSKIGKMGEDIGKAGWETGRSSASTIMGDTGAAVRRGRKGLGYAIAIIVKAFVFLILAAVAIGLAIGLILLMGSGVGFMPLKNFFLRGMWQNVFAWGTLLLFIGVPILAFLTWTIRRLMRVRSHNRYIGYTFSGLWFLGLFCVIGLTATVSRDFSTPNAIVEDFETRQPANNKLVLTMDDHSSRGYSNWLDFEGAVSVEDDTLFMNTARINVVRSSDSLYHMHIVKISNGRDNQNSKALVEKINFPVTQQDSTVYLPESFGISSYDKWRNQRVLVVVEVPEGKVVRLDGSIRNYDYFNIEVGSFGIRNNRNNRRLNLPRNWTDGEYMETDRDYIMTDKDLVPVTRKGRNGKVYRWNEEEPKNDNKRDENESNEDEDDAPVSSTKALKDSIRNAVLDSIRRAKPGKIDTIYRYNQTINIKKDNPQQGSAFLSPLASVIF